MGAEAPAHGIGSIVTLRENTPAILVQRRDQYYSYRPPINASRCSALVVNKEAPGRLVLVLTQNSKSAG